MFVFLHGRNYTSRIVLVLLAVVLHTQAFLQPLPSSSRSASKGVALQAVIRAVETIDASFTLSPEADATLRAYLKSPDMIKEVMKQINCQYAEFTGKIFQPIAYTPSTPLGMPREYEQYHLNPSFAICNVPPIIMFKAKVFKPARLCAIYEIQGLAEEEYEKIMMKQKSKMDLSSQIAVTSPITTSASEEEEQMLVDDETDSRGRKDGQAEGGNDWAKIGRAIRHVVETFEGDEGYDDDADLDAMVV